jgi:hypothetical protein
MRSLRTHGLFATSANLTQSQPTPTLSSRTGSGNFCKEEVRILLKEQLAHVPETEESAVISPESTPTQ